MIGIIIMIIMLGIEIGFTIYCMVTKSYQKDKKGILRLAQFALITLLTLIGVLRWGISFNMLLLILLIKAILAIWYFVRKKNRIEKPYGKKHAIMSCITNIFLIGFAIVPAIIFPQFKPIKVTGDYDIKTISYTLTDPNRMETFSDKDENRKVTIQFWYPDKLKEKYPLVIFSHGAFGFRGSNASTFQELASNGYVVCSIDHTYHSFFTKQTDGHVVIANMGFINDAMAAQNDDYDDQKTYELSHEWLNLRLGDVNFVLEDILGKANSSTAEGVYQFINTNEIGIFGHSLGGATAAQIGRERKDIDAVVVVDGTMFGEEVGFEDGKAILDKTPYPVPLLNIYNEEHYNEALQLSDSYANISATKNAIDAKQLVVKGAGHLNFTDLPMFSPFLANMLGTGDVDSRYCIKTMNQVILNYFNYYLKDFKELSLLEEY